MKGLFYETKKMMIYQKGLVIILAFLMLSAIMLLATDKPYNYETENYKAEYTYYLNKLSGKCTFEKDVFIENEAKMIFEAKKDIDNLYNDYYDKKVLKSDFDTELDRLLRVTENEKGFEEIHKQYIYVRENIDNRYIINTNGWNGLLANNSLDLMLVLLVILLVTPVFCNEYSSKMDSLALTSKKGSINFTLYKIILSVIVIALICIASFMIRYAFYDMKYGLINGEYPLQSLSYFSTSTKNISLLDGYIVICALKILGFIFFDTLILFISVLTKKYSLIILISIAVIIIPYIGLNVVQKYIFPLPLSMMIATGFLKGNVYKQDFYSGETISIFEEPSQGTLLILLFSFFAIVAFFLVVIRLKNKNAWNVRARRNTKIISLLFMCCLFFNGCSTINQLTNNEYNFQSKNVYYSNTFKYFVDIEKNQIFAENIETGEQEPLVRNSLNLQMKEAPMLFGNGDYVYYIKHNMKEVRLNLGGEELESVAIVEIDTKTYNEKIIFEKPISFNKDSVLGIGNYNNAKWQFLISVQGFFLDENNIYFIDNDIKQVNRDTGAIKIIDVNTIPSVSFDGENIYYVGQRAVLSKYNVNSNEYSEITDLITTRFLIRGRTIVYINRLDDFKLYCYNLDDGQNKKIYDSTVDYFEFDDEHVIITDKANVIEHRLSLNSIMKELGLQTY